MGFRTGTNPAGAVLAETLPQFLGLRCRAGTLAECPLS